MKLSDMTLKAPFVYVSIPYRLNEILIFLSCGILFYPVSIPYRLNEMSGRMLIVNKIDPLCANKTDPPLYGYKIIKNHKISLS